MANAKRNLPVVTDLGRELPVGRAAAGRPTLSAIALLKADHREVEGYFEAFEKARPTIARSSGRENL